MLRDEGIRLLQGGKRGIAEWNRRRRTRATVPNLKKCVLPRADLRGADLTGVNLRRADLRDAQLRGARLAGAALQGADLRGAHAARSEFRQADLSDANLASANLAGADLRSVNLEGSALIQADFRRANLNGARLRGAVCMDTNFGDVNLSAAEGLEFVNHLGPSEIAISTLRRSGGTIPGRFLRGCGLPDWQVLATKLCAPDLSNELLGQIQRQLFDLRTRDGVQVAPLFVSHCGPDEEMASAVVANLEAEGLRCWLDPHPHESDPSVRHLERILRLEPLIVVILSEASVSGRWLETEVRHGVDRSRRLRRSLLWPVSRDGAWKKCAHRSPFSRWFRCCPPLDLARWRDRDFARDRLRTLVHDLHIVVGTGCGADRSA